MVFEDLSKNKRPWKKPFNIQCPVLIGGNLGTSSKFIKSNAWVPWNVEIHLWIFYDSGDAGQFQWTRCLNQHYAVSKPLFVGIPFLIAKPSKQHQLVEPSSFKTYAQIKLDHATLSTNQKSQGQPPGWMYFQPEQKHSGDIYRISGWVLPGFLNHQRSNNSPTWYFCRRQALWSARPTWGVHPRRTQKMTLKNVMVQKGRSKFCLKLYPKKLCNISDVIFKMSFKTYLGQQKQSHFLMILCCISKGAKFWVSPPEFHLFASFFQRLDHWIFFLPFFQCFL